MTHKEISIINEFEKLKNNGGITFQELDDFFSRLAPVHPDDIIGVWKGGGLKSHNLLLKWFFKDFIIAKWFGKQFVSWDNAKAQVWTILGKRIPIPIGSAILRKMEFRNSVSTSMIYDYLPIVDHFRKIDDCVIMGIMEMKGRIMVYFYLEKDRCG